MRGEVDDGLVVAALDLVGIVAQGNGIAAAGDHALLAKSVVDPSERLFDSVGIDGVAKDIVTLSVEFAFLDIDIIHGSHLRRLRGR